MIYFTQDTRTKDIKIGYSKNPSKRRSGLQTATPNKLEIIGVIHGGLEHESALHERFAAYRIHGEWFRGEILSAVREIIARNPIDRPPPPNVIVAGDSDPWFIWSSDPRQQAERDALGARIHSALDQIHSRTPIAWVIFAGERQIEVFAEQWARTNQVQTYPYPLNYRRFGKGAAGKAGKQMLRAMFDPKTLLVFPATPMGGNTRTLIRQAEKMKIDVVVCERIQGTSIAPEAVVVPPAREVEIGEPAPVGQSGRRHAATEDVPWTRLRPATTPDLDDDDDLPPWARKR